MPDRPRLTPAARDGDLTVEELLDAAIAAESVYELALVANAAITARLHLTLVHCARCNDTLPLQHIVLGHMFTHDRWRRAEDEKTAGLYPGSHTRGDFRPADTDEEQDLLDREEARVRMRAGIIAIREMNRDRPRQRRVVA
jgi:hypothetical protein